MGPEAGLGVGPCRRACWRLLHHQPKLLVPVLGECYQHWLLRKSPMWGSLPAPASPSGHFSPRLPRRGVDRSPISGSSVGGRGGHWPCMEHCQCPWLPWSRGCASAWDPHETCQPRTLGSAENAGIHWAGTGVQAELRVATLVPSPGS